MSFAQAPIKAIAQAPPPAIVVATAIGLYLASAPLGHLVERQVVAWSTPHYIFVPVPAPTPQATPTATPEPSPIAGPTPQPNAAPSPVTNASAGDAKRAAPIEDSGPRAPEPTPTVIAGPASPSVVVPLPLVTGPTARAVPAPQSGRRWHDRPARLPRVEPERVRPPIVDELSRELGGGERLPREPGGFSEDFPRRYGSPFRGGFPFMRRPMLGGGFRPPMRFGGFGHFHLF